MSDVEKILTKEQIMSAPNGQRLFGLVYVHDYDEYPAKNGSMFFSGNAECVGAVGFKVWAGATFNQIKESPVKSTICDITCEVNEYAGTKSIIITDIKQYEGTELTPDMFFEQKYDAQDLWNRLTNILKKNTSENAYKVFELIMEKHKDVFMKEYAAISHHDACMSGLLAHTKKVVSIAQIIMWYPNIVSGVNVDVLFIGAALHDIGKILEYNNGVISEEGKKMSHLTLGVELVGEFKSQIVELMGEGFYDDIIAIINQHHGEFGERPRTVAAYVIHLIDILESKLTDIDDMVAQSTSDQFKTDGYYLSFRKE